MGSGTSPCFAQICYELKDISFNFFYIVSEWRWLALSFKVITEWYCLGGLLNGHESKIVLVSESWEIVFNTMYKKESFNKWIRRKNRDWLFSVTLFEPQSNSKGTFTDLLHNTQFKSIWGLNMIRSDEQNQNSAGYEEHNGWTEGWCDNTVWQTNKYFHTKNMVSKELLAENCEQCILKKFDKTADKRYLKVMSFRNRKDGKDLAQDQTNGCSGREGVKR